MGAHWVKQKTNPVLKNRRRMVFGTILLKKSFEGGLTELEFEEGVVGRVSDGSMMKI
jgi:hypothetical protein